MSENLENRISSEQAKDAIFKMHSIQSSASEIDNIVTNGATQADLDALALSTGNLTASQVATIDSLSGLQSSASEIDELCNTFQVGKNLFNPDTCTQGVYIHSSGSLSANSGYSTSDYIEIEPNTNYVSNLPITFSLYYDENKTKISAPANNIKNFISPSNAKYIRFSANNASMTRKMQFEKGTISTTFEFYKKSFKRESLDLSNEPHIITVSLDDDTTDFTGRRSIQDALDSITDASPDKLYTILANDGVYTATSVAEFDNTDKCFIQSKDYVTIKGKNRDNFIIYGELPDNLGTAFRYDLYQPVYHRGTECKIENATVIAKNCRYPIHNDNAPHDSIQYLKNCKLIHYGNYGDASNILSWNPYGLGTKSGSSTIVENTILSNTSVHNNINFTNPSLVKYVNCNITGRNDDEYHSLLDVIGITVQSISSGVKDKLVFEKCSIAKGLALEISALGSTSSPLKRQFADRNNYEIILTDNEPLAVKNNGVSGSGLKITSKSTGVNSTVRFDSSSSAFRLIISNTLSPIKILNDYQRISFNGYEYFDGGQSLNGYAVGSLGIKEDVPFSSLGARLGDCSTTNKTLGVIIDGVTYNIIFNTNLTSATNASVISLITAVIGSVATVEEYALGKDYYPQFKGNTSKENVDTTEILAGMGVVFVRAGTIRKATNADGRIDGIALDNCIVGGKTRVITCGQIYTRNSGQRFAIQQSANTATTYGTKLGMSATAGIFEINATPTLLRGVGTNIVEIV